MTTDQVIRAAFAEFLTSQGFSERSTFDMEAMGLAFDTGRLVEEAGVAAAERATDALRLSVEARIALWRHEADDPDADGSDRAALDVVSICANELAQDLAAWRDRAVEEGSTVDAVPAAREGTATPAQVLAAVAIRLFEDDQPAEMRIQEAVEILEMNGVNYRGEMAAVSSAAACDCETMNHDHR